MALLFCEINNFNIYTIFIFHFRYSINKQIFMAKIYSKEKLASSKMLPKKETIQLILSYSAAFNVVKVGKLNFEFVAN